MYGRIYQTFISSPIGYLIISAASLIYLSWPPIHASFLSVLAFVPILMLIDKCVNQQYSTAKIVLYIYSVLALWNVSTTWWIYNATAAGAVFALLVNALLMLIPFVFFILLYKKGSIVLSYVAWVSFYITFEYWHLNWELSWPWLTLGNCFAKMPYLVQWYEYTGVLGGSIWILVSNLVLFHALKFPSRINTTIVSMVLVLPVALSFLLYYTTEETGIGVKVVVVQPNIDPYLEKFPGSSQFIAEGKQIERFISLTKQGLQQSLPTTSTPIVLWPETALPLYVDETNIRQQKLLLYLDSFARAERILLISGIDSYKYYGSEKGSATAKISSIDGVSYYDTYNAAIGFQAQDNFRIYHKSKLVPGVESLPYPEIFGGLTANLGGIVSTLGYDTTTTTYFTKDGIGVSPVICYESIFGDYVRKFVAGGSSIIGIITNDGWWGKTPGHQQHWHYARLRAIENRKPIARAANTGISGFINSRGDILEETSYWVKDVRAHLLHVNKDTTFYTKQGDYLGRISIWISLLVFIVSFFVKK
ncbi:MAG: apolipoprotein N-acyltransferase [Cytophagaceae bacterium]|jgi:apolipoprotein N-acyltransferase|nr:apolipoprotein N-acyltransferase [Cytophagaceae bacterium]